MKRLSLIWFLLAAFPALAQISPGVQSINGVPGPYVFTGAGVSCVSTTCTFTTGGGSGTVTSVSVTTVNGVSGTVATATTTPAISLTLGAITPSSVLATGIVDGQAPVTVTTSTTNTLGGTYKSGYTISNNGSSASTFTLPTAAAGLQYCVRNIAVATSTLKIATSATGQFIDNAGAYSATGGYVISGGALGDSACAVGIDTTHWMLFIQSGTWTTH